MVLLLLSFLSAGCGDNVPLDVEATAEREHAQGKSQEAIFRLRDLLSRDPTNAAANLLLGRILLEIGNVAAAEEPLSFAYDAERTRDKARPLLLRTWFHSNQLSKILDATNPDAEMQSSSDPEVLVLRGSALVKQKKLAEATAVFDRIMQDHPEYPAALVGKAQLASARGKPLEAISFLDRTLARSPRLFDAWFLKAEIERSLGDLAAAHKSYGHALDIVPENAAVLLGMAAVEIGQRRYERARATLDSLRKNSAGSPSADYLLAFADFQEGNYKAARDVGIKLLATTPNHVPALVLTGASEFALGSFVDAARHLRGAAERSGLPLPTVGVFAAALFQSDQAELALEIAAAGLASAPNDLNLRSVAGEAALHLKRTSLAVEHLSMAVQIEPNSAFRRTRLAVALSAAGALDRAATEFAMAGKLDRKSKKPAIEHVVALIRKNDFTHAGKLLNELSKSSPDASALVRNLEAAVALGNRDTATARLKLRQALETDSAFSPSALNLARLEINAKNYPKATDLLADLLRKDPNNLPATLAMADLDQRLGASASDIVKRLEKARSAHPQAPEPLLLLAAFHMRNGLPQEAERFAQEARRAAPDRPEVFEMLGTIQLETQDYANAVASFAKLVSFKLGSAEAHYKLGRAQLGVGSRASARLSFQAALGISPSHVDAKVALASMEMDEGNFPRALSLARELQVQTPKSAVGILTEADVHTAAGRYAQAARMYRAAFELSPSPIAALRLHETLLILNRAEEADQHLFGWLKQRPKESIARMYLATSLVQRHQNDLAARLYLEVLEHNSEHEIALSNLAVVLQRMGDPRALEVTMRALKLRPDSATLLDNLARIHFAKNEFSRSQDLWERAVSLAPDSSDMRYRYAVVLEKTGRRRLAVNELRRALETPQAFPGREEAEKLLEILDPEAAAKKAR